MRAPQELYTVHREVHFDAPPVLVYAFSGFVDAGGGVRLAADHILQTCDFQLVATFDVDELIDYRARRPRMSFVVDHFASVGDPADRPARGDRRGRAPVPAPHGTGAGLPMAALPRGGAT